MKENFKILEKYPQVYLMGNNPLVECVLDTLPSEGDDKGDYYAWESSRLRQILNVLKSKVSEEKREIVYVEFLQTIASRAREPFRTYGGLGDKKSLCHGYSNVLQSFFESFYPEENRFVNSY